MQPSVNGAALSGGLLLSIAIFLLAVSPPMTSTFGAYNAQRIVEIAALALLNTAHPPRALLRDMAGLALCLFFISGLISTIAATNPLWAGIEYVRILLLFLLAFRIAYECKITHETHSQALVLVASALAVKVSVGLYVVNQLGGGISALADAFTNHRHFTEFFVAIESFFAFYLLNNSKSKAALLAIIPLTLITIVISIGAARASAIALCTSIFFYLAYCEKKKLSIGIFCLAAGLGQLILGLTSSQSISQSILRQQDSGRLQLWTIGMNHWKENKIFGLGPMHFSSITNDIAAHPHNIAIQLLCEWGLSGALFIGIFFAIYYASFHRANPIEIKKALPAMATITGLIASAMFGGVFVVPAVEFIFFVLLGLSITPGLARWIKWDLMPIPVGIYTFALCVLTFLSWNWQAEDTPRGAPIDAPRFWQNGGIPPEVSPGPNMSR